MELSTSPQSVADLLSQARAAHAVYRTLANHASKFRDLAGQDAQLQIEHDSRAAAHLRDPQRLDPAWAEDQALNKGVSSDEMLAFCRGALNQAVTAVRSMPVSTVEAGRNATS